LIYLRRRRSRRGGQGGRRGKAPSANVDLGGPDVTPRPFPSTSMLNLSGTAPHASLPSVGAKLYDPSDPSTFPPTVLSMSPSPPLQMRPGQGHSPQSSSETNDIGYFSSGYNSIMPVAQPRQRGIPEVY
jgi:hypothetical protein